MLQNLYLRKAGIALASFIFLLAGSVMTAHADTFVVVGNSNPTATATINITSLTNSQLVFTVTNTSGGVVTGVGFDVPGANAFTGSVGAQPAGQNFSFVTSAGNVPQFNSANLDFAFVTHVNNNGTGNFAGGNPPTGIQPGATSATFTVNGDFTGFTQQQIADAIYVRFQSLNTNPDSDVGHGGTCTNCGQVPEPTTMVLLGTGLAGLAAKVRKRRKATQE
ncbi:MAG TPA: PEP-CTERM sorting domain-containing protein [Pyrinomonadaceae bacterium]|jgi:hypothetical protein